MASILMQITNASQLSRIFPKVFPILTPPYPYFIGLFNLKKCKYQTIIIKLQSECQTMKDTEQSTVYLFRDYCNGPGQREIGGLGQGGDNRNRVRVKCEGIESDFGRVFVVHLDMLFTTGQLRSLLAFGDTGRGWVDWDRNLFKNPLSFSQPIEFLVYIFPGLKGVNECFGWIAGLLRD